MPSPDKSSGYSDAKRDDSFQGAVPRAQAAMSVAGAMASQTRGDGWLSAADSLAGERVVAQNDA